MIFKIKLKAAINRVVFSEPVEANVENKDVDLRVLHPVIPETAAPVGQKRSSTETLEGKVKKNKTDKFDM